MNEPAFTEVYALLDRINDAIVNPLIILLIALAVAYFLWGVVQFITHANNEEARRVGQQHMMWGIIGIVIMVSVFAIIRIVLNSFGVDPPPNLPSNQL